MALPLRAKASLIWRMFRDPDVPLVAKSMLPIIVGYLALPFDIVPDFIPVAGQIDDLIVFGLGLWLFVILTPRRVVESHLRAFE